MSDVSAYLNGQKKAYILSARTDGGKARGFRKYIAGRMKADPGYFEKLMFDAWMEAATKNWERQSRRRGPDLFSINDYTIPEFLTRPATPKDDEAEAEAEAEADDTEAEAATEEEYEKVDQKYATVNDLYADATIKLRNAARAGAVAEDEMKAADEARRRAQGRLEAFLRDVTD
jgi:hypothetical protein